MPIATITRRTGSRTGSAVGSAAATYAPPTVSPALFGQLSRAAITGQQAANVSRIPGAAGLEEQSSEVIAGLLNPPAFFPEVDRRAAEGGTAAGIAGSPAAFGAGVRMTDEERLRRLALGQQFLSAAYGRNPAANLPDPLQAYLAQTLTPVQAASLDLDRDRLNFQERQFEFERMLRRYQLPGTGTAAPTHTFRPTGFIGPGFPQ